MWPHWEWTNMPCMQNNSSFQGTAILKILKCAKWSSSSIILQKGDHFQRTLQDMHSQCVLRYQIHVRHVPLKLRQDQVARFICAKCFSCCGSSGLVSVGSRWPGSQSPSGSWCPAGGSCPWGAFRRRTSAGGPGQCPPELVAVSSAGRWCRSCWRSGAGLCRWRAVPSAGTLSSGPSGALGCPSGLPRFFLWSGWGAGPGSTPVAGNGFRAHRNTRLGTLKSINNHQCVIIMVKPSPQGQ